MATAADLIKSSLRLAGVIASGETPSASESSDALDVLNDILEEWSNDGFMIFEKKIEELSFVANQGTYTIGSGGDFDTTRPMMILGARAKEANQNYEYPIEIFNIDQWRRISLKTQGNTIPNCLYYNAGFPLGELNFWPVPTAANKVILYSLKPLSSLSLSTSLSYPPGYKKALKYALAAELAAEFGRSLSPKVEDVAIKSKAALQRANTDPVYMESDALAVQNERYSIYKFWRGD